VGAGIHALHHKEKKHDNNHKLVDCCVLFCIRWRSSSPLIALIVRSREHHCDRCHRSINSIKQVSLLAIVAPIRSRNRAIKRSSRVSSLSIMQSLIAILVAIDHAIIVAVDRLVVRHELRRDRTCDRSMLQSNMLVREVLLR
jgi:hypothetical protein